MIIKNAKIYGDSLQDIEIKEGKLPILVLIYKVKKF